MRYISLFSGIEAAFCAWTLAGLTGMVRDEIAKRNDETSENMSEGESE